MALVGYGSGSEDEDGAAPPALAVPATADISLALGALPAPRQPQVNVKRRKHANECKGAKRLEMGRPDRVRVCVCVLACVPR